MSVCITGATGFIGSKVFNYFKNKNINVEGFDISNCDDGILKEVNIKNKKEVFDYFEERKKIDTVIHLAGKPGVRSSIDNPIKFVKSNVTGTQIVLEACRKFDIDNFIFASTYAVYPDVEKPLNENMKTDWPTSPYIANKKACEVHSYSYHHLFNISCHCLRFFTVYGPPQERSVIHVFADKINNQEKVSIFGDENSYRDYIFIDDIINGIFKSYKRLQNVKNEYEIINLGTGEKTTLIEVVDILAEKLNKNYEYEVINPNSIDMHGACADTQKASNLINFDSKVGVEKGLEKYVNWFLNK